MERIELKCSSCGGALTKIETLKDTYICIHCGNKEIIKEESPSVSYVINQAITKNIYGNESPGEEDYYKLIENAEKYIQVDEYKKAIELAVKALEIDEGNYLAWWIGVKAKLLFNIKNKEHEKKVIYYSLKNIEDNYKKAYTFADDVAKKIIDEEYKSLYKKYCTLIDGATQYVEANFTPAESDMNKIAKVYIIAAVAVFAIALFSVIFMIVKRVDDLAAIAFFGVIFGGIFIGKSFQTKDYNVLIEYIKTKDRVSFDELFEMVIKDISNANNSKLINKIVLNDKLKENMHKNVANWIKEGHLIGYKIEDGYIVRTSKPDNNDK